MAKASGWYKRVCPICRMNSGVNNQLSEGGKEFVCAKDPKHKFIEGKDGYLESVK